MFQISPFSLPELNDFLFFFDGFVKPSCRLQGNPTKKSVIDVLHVLFTRSNIPDLHKDYHKYYHTIY